jgi:hypothetical protein
VADLDLAGLENIGTSEMVPEQFLRDGPSVNVSLAKTEGFIYRNIDSYQVQDA